MNRVKLCENVVLEPATESSSCPLSMAEIEPGEYAVTAGDGLERPARIALGSVDTLARILHRVDRSDDGDDLPSFVTYYVKFRSTDHLTGPERSCAVCHRPNEEGEWQMTIVGIASDPKVSVCPDCTGELADALDSVWEYGDLIAPAEL